MTTTTLESACDDVRDAGPDDHVDGVPAAQVVRPASTEETAEVLRAAAAAGLAVVPRGHGTKLTWGAPPRRVDVLLDLTRMDQVLDHAAGDLIVETQAGATLSAVQDVVGQARQRVTVDDCLPGASVGGILATHTSGPRRVAVGTMRDLLIGLTMVRADGVVAKAGGRVVKNVAGYDLGKLMIGSFGTLAVVTEALFRLHPVPGAQRFVTVEVDGAQAAHDLVQAVVHAQVVPAAVEVEQLASGPVRVTVLLEGREQGVEGRAATTRSLLGDGSTVSDAGPEHFTAYPWDLHARGDDRATALKLTTVLSGLADVLSVARTVGAHVRGSGGAGVLHASLPSGTEVAEVVSAVAALREVCTRNLGSTVVLDAPAAVKRATDLWGPIPALDLMHRVKDQFDPDHRLSPGRFVGGM